MSTPTTAQSKFVAILAKLVAPMDFEAAAQAIMDMLPALADLPDGVFCDASAEHVGRNESRIPSYASLRKRLELWWQVNQPKTDLTQIGVDDPSLDADDLGWLRNWQRHKDEGFTGISAATDLRLARQHRPRVFAYLLRTDTRAAEVAVLNHWTLPEQQPRERSAEEIAHVEAVRDAAIRVIAQANLPPQAARETIDGVREDVARRTAEFVAKHGRKPGEATPEQLAAIRKAAGIKPPPAPKPKPMFAEAEAPEFGGPAMPEMPPEIFTSPEMPPEKPEPRKYTTAEIIAFRNWKAPWDDESDTESDKPAEQEKTDAA
jgi:hypothetical protein